MLVETEAIILNSRKYGDSSKIITVYTFEAGKQSLIAKGCRSPKSKFAAILDPMTILKISFNKKYGKELNILSKSEPIQLMKHISSSMNHLSSGLLILETVISTQHPDEKNDELFELIKNSLTELNKPCNNPFSLFVYFTIAFARLSGFEIFVNYPDEFQDDEYFFNLQNGTVFVKQINFSKFCFRFDKSLILKLIDLSLKDLQSAEMIEFEDYEKRIIIAFFTFFFSFHLERSFLYKSTELM